MIWGICFGHVGRFGHMLSDLLILTGGYQGMAFKKGVSGNPSGRPKGVQDRRTIFRDMVEPSSNQLIQKAIDMALDGNESMLRLLLDRVLPAKPREELIDVDIKSGTQVSKAKKILGLLSSGTIAPTVAKCLMDTLATEVRLIEFEVLESKIKAIEDVIKYGTREDEWVNE